MKNTNQMNLDEFKNKHYGEKGSKRREELESGYDSFKNEIKLDLQELVPKKSEFLKPVDILTTL